MRTLTLLPLLALLLSLPARAGDTDADGVSDAADAFPCDPGAASVVFAPAEGEHGLLLFEDRWPSNGDLDFNDVALSYNYVFQLNPLGHVTSLQLNVNVLAVGASLSNGVWLRLPVAPDQVASIQRNSEAGNVQALTPVAGEADTVVELLADARSVFAQQGGFVNTTTVVPARRGRGLNVVVRFKAPVPLDVAAAPFDLFIARTQTPGHQIHLPRYDGTAQMDRALFGTADDASREGHRFVNKQGLPFVLHLPALIAWPQETVAIDRVYPDVVGFAASGGTQNQDWYASSVRTAEAWRGGADGTPPPLPVVVGPTAPIASTACLPWKGSAQFGQAAWLYAENIASDSVGNVFLSGIDWTDDNNLDLFVRKLGHDGREDQVLVGSALEETGRGLAVDGAGEVYVAGSTTGVLAPGALQQGSGDVFVRKLSTNLVPVWTAQLGTEGYEEAHAVAVGPDGAIYVAGYTGGSAWGGDPTDRVRPFLARLEAIDGSLSWVKAYHTETGHAFASGLAVDRDGNLAVTLNHFDSVANNWRASLAKYDANGDALPGWPKPAAALASELKWANAVATDASGAMVAVGWVEPTAISCQPVRAEICTDAFGCVTQTSDVCGPVREGFVEKRDASGNLAWDRRIQPAFAFLDEEAYTQADVRGVMMDGAGGVFVAGGIKGAVAGATASGDFDAFVARYAADSTQEWLTQQGTPLFETAAGVCAAPDGLYVGGSTYGELPGATGSGQGFISKYNLGGVRQ